MINLRSTAFPWLILFAVYLGLDVFVTGFARWEFPYAVLYAVTFLAISMVLAINKPNFLTGLMLVVMGILVTFVQLNGIPIDFALGLAAVAFVVMFLAEFNVIKLKSDPGVRYLSVLPFLMLIFFAVIYFYHRITTPGLELNAATALNHIGIGLVAFDGMVRVTGRVKTWYIMAAGLSLAVISAVWMTVGLGWGLQLI